MIIMTKEDLFNMKLHQSIEIVEHVFVFRVFGGWIYSFIGANTTSVFVPKEINVCAKVKEGY